MATVDSMDDDHSPGTQPPSRGDAVHATLVSSLDALLTSYAATSDGRSAQRREADYAFFLAAKKTIAVKLVEGYVFKGVGACCFRCQMPLMLKPPQDEEKGRTNVDEEERDDTCGGNGGICVVCNEADASEEAFERRMVDFSLSRAAKDLSDDWSVCSGESDGSSYYSARSADRTLSVVHSESTCLDSVQSSDERSDTGANDTGAVEVALRTGMSMGAAFPADNNAWGNTEVRLVRRCCDCGVDVSDYPYSLECPLCVVAREAVLSPQAKTDATCSSAERGEFDFERIERFLQREDGRRTEEADLFEEDEEDEDEDYGDDDEESSAECESEAEEDKEPEGEEEVAMCSPPQSPQNKDQVVKGLIAKFLLQNKNGGQQQQSSQLDSIKEEAGNEKDAAGEAKEDMYTDLLDCHVSPRIVESLKGALEVPRDEKGDLLIFDDSSAAEPTPKPKADAPGIDETGIGPLPETQLVEDTPRRCFSGDPPDESDIKAREDYAKLQLTIEARSDCGSVATFDDDLSMDECSVRKELQRLEIQSLILSMDECSVREELERLEIQCSGTEGEAATSLSCDRPRPETHLQVDVREESSSSDRMQTHHDQSRARTTRSLGGIAPSPSSGGLPTISEGSTYAPVASVHFPKKHVYQQRLPVQSPRRAAPLSPAAMERRRQYKEALLSKRASGGRPQSSVVSVE
ncbi:hypothetical protein ACHAXT_013325 [Thalassiosira profunda]